jgi:predicted ATPase
VRLIQALARRQPVVLFLDDVQWMDPALCDLLQYAVRRWSHCGVRLLLLLTVRSEDMAAPSLLEWLESLRSAAQTTRLEIGPLDEASTRQLVATLMSGTATKEDQTTDLGGWLYAETEGYPSFLLDLLHELLEAGALALQPPQSAGWKLTMRIGLEEIVQQHFLPTRMQGCWQRGFAGLIRWAGSC